MEYQLGNVLSPWSSHEFRVQGINMLGRGQFSKPSPQVLFGLALLSVIIGRIKCGNRGESNMNVLKCV